MNCACRILCLMVAATMVSCLFIIAWWIVTVPWYGKIFGFVILLTCALIAGAAGEIHDELWRSRHG